MDAKLSITLADEGPPKRGASLTVREVKLDFGDVMALENDLHLLADDTDLAKYPALQALSILLGMEGE